MKANKALAVCRLKWTGSILYRLRFATIVEQRITTDEAELAQVAVEVGIEKTAFLNAYHSDEAKHALQKDFDWRAKLGGRALPAYLFCYADKQVLKTGVLDFDDFVAVISQISDGTIAPTPPKFDTSILQNFLAKRPLVSLAEIRHAFQLLSNQSVNDWLAKLPNTWRKVNDEFVKSLEK